MNRLIAEALIPQPLRTFLDCAIPKGFQTVAGGRAQRHPRTRAVRLLPIAVGETSTSRVRICDVTDSQRETGWRCNAMIAMKQNFFYRSASLIACALPAVLFLPSLVGAVEPDANSGMKGSDTPQALLATYHNAL